MLDQGKECFGRDGTLKGLHELLPEKLDCVMHMQGIEVDRIDMQGHPTLVQICRKITHQKNNKSLTSRVMGLFTGPHQISDSDDSSLTIRLSEGERPVLAPEYALRAPLEVTAVPVS